VLEYHAHPKYTGDTGLRRRDRDDRQCRGSAGDSDGDAGEDNLDVGSQLEFVGYGKTESGGIGTRLTVNGVIENTPATLEPAINQLVFEYNQPPSVGGPCNGDSGGPAFAQLASGKRVVGVTSYGDKECTVYGVSTRASAYYEGFIQPIISGTAAPSCSSCVDGVATGACASAWARATRRASPAPISSPATTGAGDGQGLPRRLHQRQSSGVKDYLAWDDCLCGSCASNCAAECSSKPTNENQTCDACVSSQGSTACAAQLDACNSSPDCVAYDTCLSSAVTDADVQACAQQHPQGAQELGAFVDCLCKSACPTQCAQECGTQTASCGFSTAGLGAACDGCWKNACCADGAACAADAACVGCAQDPACNSDPKYVAFASCLANQCASECGFAGAGGNAGSGGGPAVGGGPAAGGAPPAGGGSSSGSGCSLGSERSPAAWAAFALLALAAAARRRRLSR